MIYKVALFPDTRENRATFLGLKKTCMKGRKIRKKSKKLKTFHFRECKTLQKVIEIDEKKYYCILNINKMIINENLK